MSSMNQIPPREKGYMGSSQHSESAEQNILMLHQIAPSRENCHAEKARLHPSKNDQDSNRLDFISNLERTNDLS